MTVNMRKDTGSKRQARPQARVDARVRRRSRAAVARSAGGDRWLTVLIGLVLLARGRRRRVAVLRRVRCGPGRPPAARPDHRGHRGRPATALAGRRDRGRDVARGARAGMGRPVRPAGAAARRRAQRRRRHHDQGQLRGGGRGRREPGGTLPGVARARARLVGSAAAPALRVTLWLADDADVRGVLARLPPRCWPPPASRSTWPRCRWRCAWSWSARSRAAGRVSSDRGERHFTPVHIVVCVDVTPWRASRTAGAPWAMGDGFSALSCWPSGCSRDARSGRRRARRWPCAPTSPSRPPRRRAPRFSSPPRAGAREPPPQRLHPEPPRQPGRPDSDRPHAARRLRHPHRAARPGTTRARHRHARRSCAQGRSTCRAAPRSPPVPRCSCWAIPRRTRRHGGPSAWPRRSRCTCSASTRSSGWIGAAQAPTPSTAPTLPRAARSSTPTRPPWTPPCCWSGPARWCRPATSRWTVSSAVSPARPRPTTSRRFAKPSASRGSRRLGTGDGARALADWARAHPRAVGRLVLDGPPDPRVDEPGRSEARAKSTEAAFDAFAQSCTSRSSCPLGADPRTTVAALVASLRANR